MQNNSLLNVEKNKGCNIDITVVNNQTDALSLDSINNNYKDITKIEDLFTDRLDVGTDILTKKLLPKQLQEDFEIVPKFNGKKISFEASAKTDDAYKKFPIHLKYNMKFDSVEEADKFRKNGLNKLIEQAEKTGKPIEIPNITSMKEFLGEFENPVGHANKYGSEGVKLYICPSPMPPAQVYTIDIYNSDYSFRIDTSLRLEKRDGDNIKLTNKESTEEPFNVAISLTNMEKTDDGVSGKFNITISIREKYLNDSEYNLKMLKYKYLMDDNNTNINVSNKKLNQNIFTFNNFEAKGHTNKEKKFFKRLAGLIEKVLYISKTKNINIKYNLDEILREEKSINILYAESTGKKCTINEKMKFNQSLEINKDTKKYCKQGNKFELVTKLDFVTIFNKKITLKDNETIFKECIIQKVEEIGNIYKIEFEAEKIIFKCI